jgi:hypothetical protein
MRTAPGLIDCAASVLDADPRLARPLSAHDAAGVGRAPLLPVLAVEAGPWAPPGPDALGPRTRGLAVLAGLVVRDGSAVAGPGDLIDPWDEHGDWRACTPVRFAVVGAAFAAAIEAWPDISEQAGRPRARALSLRGLAGEAPEPRLLGLLWRLALRWSGPSRHGLALALPLDVAALARLLDLPEADVRLALDELLARGVLVRREDGGWLLPPPAGRIAGLRGRRDRLRAQLAVQCALSRAACEESQILCEQLDQALQQRAVTRARRRSA